MQQFQWSKAEKEVARSAYDKAYGRECSTIQERLKAMVAAATEPADIWRIHNYLSQCWRDFYSKYDYRYSVLLWVFARLLREGWLWLTEAVLNGLDDDKIEKVKLAASI